VKIEELRQLINEHFENEEYEKSLDFCCSLLKEHEGELTAGDLINKGLCHFRLDQNDEAVGCFDRALQIEPDNIMALTNKAVSLYNLGKIDESFKLFGQVLTRNPDIFPAWYYIGLHNLKKFSNSADAGTKAIVVNAYRQVTRMAPDFGSFAIHDPAKGIDYTLELFLLLNDDIPDLSVEEITAL
jgi:tetratricopeptide (TPR) repeat protein